MKIRFPSSLLSLQASDIFKETNPFLKQLRLIMINESICMKVKWWCFKKGKLVDSGRMTNIDESCRME